MPPCYRRRLQGTTVGFGQVQGWGPHRHGFDLERSRGTDFLMSQDHCRGCCEFTSMASREDLFRSLEELYSSVPTASGNPCGAAMLAAEPT